MKKTPLWLLLLAALGVPTVVGTLLSNVVNQHPFVAVGCILLYEVGIFVFSIVGKIWQQLEGNWVIQISSYIDVKVQTLISQYYRRYRRYLTSFHGYIDLKGLSTQGPYNPELDQVFVDLSVISQPWHLSGANPLQNLQKEGQSIWYYLTAKMHVYHNLVILGPPGSGKTTLLKHVALSLIARSKTSNLHISHKLPILLLLRDHADAIGKRSDFSLLDSVQDQLKKWNEDVSSKWIRQKLVKGRCLILLDGLDEVANSALRSNVVNWVQQQMVKYAKNRFIITSRPYGYSSDSLMGVTILSLNTFKDDKIREFVHKWYIFNEIASLQRNDQGVRMRAKNEAEELLRRLYENPNLPALAVNPLLLTMIVMVHRFRGTLPGSRVDLYREICDVLLGKRQAAKGLALELNAAQQLRVLQPLAYFMMLEGIKDISILQAQKVIADPLKRVSRQMQPEAFLLFIENNSGLLLEREHGIYSFAHSCFQEYLAATYLQEERQGEVLINKVELSWWQETIRLYCALTDATPIILACLAKNPPSTIALTLAIDCQREHIALQPEVSDQLDALLDQGQEDSDPERQRIVAEALLNRRLQRMTYIKQGKFIDKSLVTCAEYQIFIDTQSLGGNYSQPDHWTEGHFLPTEGGTPILGIRASDAIAFCEWLTNREPSEWIYRIPKSDEITEGEKEFDGQTDGLAYWLDGGKAFAWFKEFRPPLDKIKENLNLSQALNFDLDSQLDRAKLLDNVINLGRNEGLAQDLVRVRPYVQKIANRLNKIDELELICLNDLEYAHNRARALNFTLDFERVFIRAQELARSPKRRKPLSHISLEDLNLTHTLDLALTHALEIAYSRKLSATLTDYNKEELNDFLLWYICLLALMIAIHLSFLKRQGMSKPNFLVTFLKQIFHFRSERKQDDDLVQQMIDIYLDIYVACTLLKKRIKGELPALEGILMVRVHKSEK